jgi:hypothetical protein
MTDIKTKIIIIISMLMVLIGCLGATLIVCYNRDFVTAAYGLIITVIGLLLAFFGTSE